ncbi:hypothetical protein EVAR_35541_1 [Eumeta japonica]|uniref:Uncharacterized protein n=1 Tax=Eumeta variegata TaxID=151549 RepID=A0A4C1X7A5_EUMVA|nr:hypothetical protein EVAR_35541_1 [Eumeta japonica]
MKLCETSVCFCGMADEDMHYAPRMKMMDGITREAMGPIHYTDLISCKAKFDRLVEFARAWHRLRGRLEEESRRKQEETAGLDYRCPVVLPRFGPYDRKVGGAMGGGRLILSRLLSLNIRVRQAAWLYEQIAASCARFRTRLRERGGLGSDNDGPTRHRRDAHLHRR